MDDALSLARTALIGGNHDTASACALVAIAETLARCERHLDVLAQIEVARMMEYGEGDPTLFDGTDYRTGRRVEDTNPL